MRLVTRCGNDEYRERGGENVRTPAATVNAASNGESESEGEGGGRGQGIYRGKATAGWRRLWHAGAEKAEVTVADTDPGISPSTYYDKLIYSSTT
uniref:Uncharacterized protein n=1 Tax=Oryza brachyantha TaxID=4533 RepID=J3MWB8_ORYBR